MSANLCSPRFSGKRRYWSGRARWMVTMARCARLLEVSISADSTVGGDSTVPIDRTLRWLPFFRATK
jgi:hypothetical protein